MHQLYVKFFFDAGDRFTACWWLDDPDPQAYVRARERIQVDGGTLSDMDGMIPQIAAKFAGREDVQLGEIFLPWQIYLHGDEYSFHMERSTRRAMVEGLTSKDSSSSLC